MKSFWKFTVNKYDIILLLLSFGVIFKNDADVWVISLIVVYCTVEIRNILIQILEKLEKNKII